MGRGLVGRNFEPGYEEVIGMEGEELNPHQKQAAKERRGRETEMIYLSRRYVCVIIQGGFRQCLECGNLVDRQNAR